MTHSEEEIEELEAQAPLKAGELFRAACERMLSAGVSVVGVIDGTLYRVNPDGTRVAIKQMPAAVSIPVGTKIKLK